MIDAAEKVNVDAVVLAGILQDYPDLWWGSPTDSRHAPERFAELRAQTLGDFGQAQFRRARAFLAAAPRTLRPNRCCSTYSWKHVAERWNRKSYCQYNDYYVGEGAFVAACIAEGVPVTIGDRASYAALSRKALNMVAPSV
jgi:hypothetical protein